jgi:hypothetical protein
VSETETRDTRRAPERRPRRRPEESDRPQRRERPPSGERPERRERPPSGQQREGNERPPSGERREGAERPERREGAERPQRSDGAERPQRRERPADEAPRRPAARRDDDRADREDGNGREDHRKDDRRDDDDGAPRGSSRSRLGAGEAARRARRELDALIRHTVEGVVAVERTEDGWVVTVDVVEDPHVPSSSDVLAEYQVRLDDEGELLAYKRGRRFVRGRVED